MQLHHILTCRLTAFSSSQAWYQYLLLYYRLLGYFEAPSSSGVTSPLHKLATQGLAAVINIPAYNTRTSTLLTWTHLAVCASSSWLANLLATKFFGSFEKNHSPSSYHVQKNGECNSYLLSYLVLYEEWESNLDPVTQYENYRQTKQDEITKTGDVFSSVDEFSVQSILWTGWVVPQPN